jgi:hypothetical protein
METQDDRISFGIATLIAYDQQCAAVPLHFKQMAQVTLDGVPPGAFKAATDKVLTTYRTAGPAIWCATNKPVVERAMRAYR